MTVLARALDWVEQGKVPDLSLVRRPARALTMAATLWQFPWMTARVVTAIHWQALRLWLKRLPYSPSSA
ncbi:MAG TPA: DUF1365 family protein [Steroidobacteraceae bacterium]|nr:DUF1365 family protein [Steroidobacteraceae bacterium]